MTWCSVGPGPAGRGEAGIGFGRPEFDFKAILARGDMTEQKLIEAAAMLARAAPGQWSEFIEALHERAVEANDQLVKSDLSFLQLNQGRAQAYSTIFRTCHNAVEKLREIEARKQNG